MSGVTLQCSRGVTFELPAEFVKSVGTVADLITDCPDACVPLHNVDVCHLQRIILYLNKDTVVWRCFVSHEAIVAFMTACAYLNVTGLSELLRECARQLVPDSPACLELAVDIYRDYVLSEVLSLHRLKELRANDALLKFRAVIHQRLVELARKRLNDGHAKLDESKVSEEAIIEAALHVTSARWAHVGKSDAMDRYCLSASDWSSFVGDRLEDIVVIALNKYGSMAGIDVAREKRDRRRRVARESNQRRKRERKECAGRNVERFNELAAKYGFRRVPTLDALKVVMDKAELVPWFESSALVDESDERFQQIVYALNVQIEHWASKGQFDAVYAWTTHERFRQIVAGLLEDVYDEHHDVEETRRRVKTVMCPPLVKRAKRDEGEQVIEIID